MKSKGDNFKIRDRRGDNRYFIDNAFLKIWGAKLGPHCIAVYNVLVMYANADNQTAYPSFQTIADLTGMSRRQVVREVEKLKSNSIIKVEERTEIAPETGKLYFLSNVFTLLHPDEWNKIDRCLHEPSDSQSLPQDTQSLGIVTGSHHPSDTQSSPLVTQSHLNNTQVNNTHITTPKGVGDKSPEVEKPKKQLMGIFLEETGLKMPHRKSDIGFWWSAINEIYGLVDNNIGLGGNTIRQVVRQMRNDKLTISSPNSIVNLCRALCANAPPARNGHKLDPEKDAIYQELMQKQKGV